MSNRQRARGNRPLHGFIVDLAHLVHAKVIEPMRRHARSRAGERALARLDDRMLRDIGLTRSQVHAAAYGLIRLGKDSPADAIQGSPAEPGNLRLKCRAIALKVDGATAAPPDERAAQG